MATRKLERSDWKPYLERLSKQLPASRVELHVDGLDIGDQIEADKAPLLGLSYDPSVDAVVIEMEGLGHQISRPREIYLEEEAGGLRSFEVLDGDGHKQIGVLSRVLELPAG